MKNMKIFLLLIVVFALTACGKAVETEPAAATGAPAETAKAAKAADPTPGKKGVIGLIVQNLSNPFFVAMSKGAAEAAKKHGGEVIAALMRV
jgi:ribose transport system substrate-binding protein